MTKNKTMKKQEIIEKINNYLNDPSNEWDKETLEDSFVNDFIYTNDFYVLDRVCYEVADISIIDVSAEADSYTMAIKNNIVISYDVSVRGIEDINSLADFIINLENEYQERLKDIKNK